MSKDAFQQEVVL